jgi:hypothetical protein
MDCSTVTKTEEINSMDNNMNDDHLLPSNDSSTGRMISVCEIRPSFYLTTPIRRLFDPSNDQSTPNDTISSTEYKPNTPSSTDYQYYKYADNQDENNKENSNYSSTLTPITSSEIQNPTEVKKSSIYKLILKNPRYN